MEAFGPCLPNNRAGGDFIRFVYLHVEVDALADADTHVVVDVDVDLPPSTKISEIVKASVLLFNCRRSKIEVCRVLVWFGHQFPERKFAPGSKISLFWQKLAR